MDAAAKPSTPVRSGYGRPVNAPGKAPTSGPTQTPALDAQPPVRPRNAGHAPSAARNGALPNRPTQQTASRSPFMDMHADIHQQIAAHLDVASTIQLARATEPMEPAVAADYRDAARREARGFLRSIDPHVPKHPSALMDERAALDRIVGRFVSEERGGPAGARDTRDADTAALTRLKLHVLKTECNEADRACLTHLVMPPRSAGPETAKAYDQILDSIGEMKNPEAQAQALVRYVFTVSLDGFPSGPAAPAQERDGGLRGFARMFFNAASAGTTEGAPPPDWHPPRRGNAQQLLQQLVQQQPHIGRALTMSAQLSPYPSEDPVTPQTIADVFSARLPHHPSMSFARFDYLTACQEFMRDVSRSR